MKIGAWATKTKVDLEEPKGNKSVFKKLGNQLHLHMRTRSIDLVTGRRISSWEDLGIVIPGKLLKPVEDVVILPYTVYEFGFSKAMLDLFPYEMKQELGDDWFDVLLYIIADVSPTSYLLSRHEVAGVNRYLGSWRKRIEKSLPMSIEALHSTFGGISLVITNEKVMLMAISEDLQKLADTYNVAMEVVL